MFNFQIQSSETSALLSLFLNLVILLSYPLNFFIYCGMSSQFRNTFRALFSLPTRRSLSRSAVSCTGPVNNYDGASVGPSQSHAYYVSLHDADARLGRCASSPSCDVTVVWHHYTLLRDATLCNYLHSACCCWCQRCIRHYIITNYSVQVLTMQRWSGNVRNGHRVMIWIDINILWYNWNW